MAPETHIRIVIIENNVLATNTIRRNLTQALISEGYQVTVLTTGTAAELQQATDTGITVQDVGASNQNVFEVCGYFFRLRRTLKSLRPHLVLTFTVRPNVWGNLAARISAIPVISNITGIGQLFSSQKLSFRIARFLYKLGLQKTKWIFFQNDDDRNLFVNKKLVSLKNSQVIPGSGVDTEFFAPWPDQPAAPFRFLFIGRLIVDKGIVEYIEAARLLKASHPEVIFEVVGPLWAQNVRSNLITRTTLDSWVRDGLIEYQGNTSDVRPYIARAQCVVLPSYREGMSNVLLEAGSMATPAIASDVTGCREIIVDGVTGLLCAPRDAASLATKMEQMILMSDDQRKIMGEEARKQMKAQFEKKIVIAAYLAAIRKIVP